MALFHPIKPVYNKDSRILILGSFPSVRSRETGFFYGHPQNRFWRVLAKVFESAVPETVEEKKELLLSHGIALWDVVASCEIVGSSDSSIKNVIPNDISAILCGSDIEAVYVNGKTAYSLYRKYILTKTKKEAVCLPSTSAANAAWDIPRLTAAWSKIKEVSYGRR